MAINFDGDAVPRLPVQKGDTAKLGRLEGMAINYSNLGVIYKLRDDLKEARTLWAQARDLFEKIGMPHRVATVQNWLDQLP